MSTYTYRDGSPVTITNGQISHFVADALHHYTLGPVWSEGRRAIHLTTPRPVGNTDTGRWRCRHTTGMVNSAVETHSPLPEVLSGVEWTTLLREQYERQANDPASVWYLDNPGMERLGYENRADERFWLCPECIARNSYSGDERRELWLGGSLTLPTRSRVVSGRESADDRLVAEIVAARESGSSLTCPTCFQVRSASGACGCDD
jgi:hypothetical protein